MWEMSMKVYLASRVSQKSLNPLTGIVVLVRAGAMEWGGGDPCGRPSSPLFADINVAFVSG